MTPIEFRSVLYGTLGVTGAELAPDVALRDQLAVESSRMVELAILLEQDLGADLDDDVDLAALSPTELHRLVEPGPTA
ncbi:hypothetical protein [Nocardiopsis sp. RV163]|uniref:hypothetical protein n=1 Tax=Nocardiopsis sp. RV163 TaxID=1661388 RepID=UPI00064BEF62|nr:hypothetical protein [Nocardiopsis sp. RV163]